MMNKLVGIFVIMLLIGIAILPVSGNVLVRKTKQLNNDSNDALSSLFQDDTLDQYQHEYVEDPLGTIWNYSVYEDQCIAQSFIPSLNVLTRVKLLMRRTSGNIMPDFFVQLEDQHRDIIGFAWAGTDEIPYLDGFPYMFYWVEFNFEPDIAVSVGEKYGIFCWSNCNSTDGYVLAFSNYSQGTPDYPNGILYTIPDCKDTWEPRSNEDLCFETYGYEIHTVPKVTCSGSLSWTDVKPGDTVTGNVTVANSGDPESLLDWEIKDWPEWGTYIFTPKSGTDLAPETGSITIHVTVVVPDEKNQEFTGDVKIVNKENNNDFCTIPISLTTLKNKQVVAPLIHYVYEIFLEGFPLVTRLRNF